MKKTKGKKISKQKRLRYQKRRIRLINFLTQVLEDIKKTGPPKPPPLPLGVPVEEIPLPPEKKLCSQCKENKVKNCIDCFWLNNKIIKQKKFTITKY